METHHADLMAAIMANKTATSIIRGERGAGKWIAGFVATGILVIVGVVDLISRMYQFFTGN